MVDGHTPTNLHSYEKPDKCLDCGGKIAFNGQSDFNLHVICENVAHGSIMIKSVFVKHDLLRLNFK